MISRSLETYNLHMHVSIHKCNVHIDVLVSKKKKQIPGSLQLGKNVSCGENSQETVEKTAEKLCTNIKYVLLPR